MSTSWLIAFEDGELNANGELPEMSLREAAQQCDARRTTAYARGLGTARGKRVQITEEGMCWEVGRWAGYFDPRLDRDP